MMENKAHWGYDLLKMSQKAIDGGGQSLIYEQLLSPFDT